MFDLFGSRACFARRSLLVASFAALLPIAACNKQQAPAAQPGPKTFDSPQDAGNALVAAAKAGDSQAVVQIFGPGSEKILSSGDATQDKASLNGFAQAYQVMNRWRKLGDGSEVLFVGADNQAFPVPLMKNASGQWYFDAAAGKEEILARRIGNNELAAIAISAAIANAQQQYFAKHHEYAQKFISDEGQQDGLYWPTPDGQPASPLGPLVAFATAEGYKVQQSKHPYYGYWFALLSKQGSDAKGGVKNYVVNGKMTGGFGVVAYPANYGDSGIMTFITARNGVVLQKDLGQNTNDVASAMTEFNPDTSWTVVE